MAKYQIDNVAAPINFQSKDIVLRTLQNAKNLLMCYMGEVPYDRYRGFDPDVFALPIMDMQSELVPELDRLMIWEPDVKVEDAEAKLLPDGSTYIKMIVNVGIAEDGSKKESVRSSAPTEPAQAVWASNISSAETSTEEDVEAAVKKANASIMKILRRAKQATETEIYGDAGRVFEVIK